MAILPDEPVRQALVDTQALVAPKLKKPKPTRPSNLHLTLAFLGECTPDQEAAALRALEAAAVEHAPFSLSLGSVGCFQKRRGGSIVWRGVEGDRGPLIDFQSDLVDALENEGLFDQATSSPGIYVPHMTLFRGARPAPSEGEGKTTDAPATSLVDVLAEASEAAPAASWQVGSASLMWSHRSEETGLLTYDELGKVDLLGSASETLAADAGAPRTLFVDADACPVTEEALACARHAGWPVVIAGNSTQNLERHIRHNDPRTAKDARHGFWVSTIDVSVGADSADFAIVERLRPSDVVVTQDIGLASMVLGRGAAAIGVRGRVYHRETIDSALLIRHEEKKVRRAGGRTTGPAKFTSEDRRRFSANLARLLQG